MAGWTRAWALGLLAALWPTAALAQPAAPAPVGTPAPTPAHTAAVPPVSTPTPVTVPSATLPAPAAAPEPEDTDDDAEEPATTEEPTPPDAEPAASDITDDLEAVQPASPPRTGDTAADDALRRLEQLERDFAAHALTDVDIPRDESDVESTPRGRQLPTGLDVLEALGTHRLSHEVELRRARDAADAYAALFRSVRRATELPAQAPTPDLKGAPLGPIHWDIPMVDNDMVRRWIGFFQGVGQKYYRLWVARYWRYGPTMRRILQEEGLPQDLVFLSMIESGFSPKAYSFANAAGQWQFIRATGARMGLTINYWVDERRDPIKATRAAARYLRELYQQFNDWHLAWASYNAGPGRVSRAIRRNQTREFFVLARGRSLRKETRNYVPKLIAAAIIGKEPAAFGFGDIEPLAPYTFDELPLTDNLHLSSVARACGTTLDELTELNPMLRRPITPPVALGADPFLLRVPAGKATACKDGLAALPEPHRLRWRRHLARPGDTLQLLATRYQTTEEAIAEQNAIPAKGRVNVGDDLLIPIPPGAPVAVGDLEDELTERRGRVVKTAPPRGAKAVKVLVRPGDTLWDIASAHGVDVRSVVAWNGLNRRRRLRPGQTLVVYVAQRGGNSGKP